jgi:hypothetical protein
MINSGSKVDLTKKLYDKKAYLNVIDTQFNELLQPTSPIEPEVNIDEFFQLYNDLFYDIPKFGEINSHEYLIKQSSDYVGSAILTDDIQALLDEITSLREENLELQRNIIDLTTNTNS